MLALLWVARQSKIICYNIRIYGLLLYDYFLEITDWFWCDNTLELYINNETKFKSEESMVDKNVDDSFPIGFGVIIR
jgi:hypothetical protein